MAAKVGTVVLDIKADTAKLVSGMEKAEKSVKKTVGNIKRTLLTIAAAYASFETVRGFASMTRDAIIASDNIGKLAEKLSITTEKLSRLQYAAGYADVSIDKISSAMSEMIRRTNNFVQYGTGAAAKAYKELGISQNEARQKMTSTNEAFFFLLDKLSQVKDSYHRTALAQDLFSKSAADVIRLSNMGADELKRLAKEADDLGLTVTTAQYNMSASFDDTVDHIKKVGEGYKRTFLLDALPAALAFAETFDKTFTESLKNASNNTLNYEDIVVSVMENIVISVSYAKSALDVFSMGWKSLELIVVGVSRAIIEVINNIYKVFFKAENLLIKGYNKIAEFFGKKTIKPVKIENLIDTSWSDNFLEKTYKELKNEAIEFDKSSAKDRAEVFLTEFKKNLKVIEAKKWETIKKNTDSYTSLSSKTDKKVSNNTLKEAEKLLKKQKKAWKDHFSYIETDWDKTVKSMSESLEKNFFDILDGKFTSLKDMFKNFANDVFVNPMKQDLSKYLSSGTLSLLGQNTVNGQTLDSYLGSQGFKEIGTDFVKWIGDSKVVIDKTGKVLQGQDKISKNTLNDLTNLKSGYDAVIDGIQGSIMKPFDTVGSFLSKNGYATAGNSVTYFGTGLANPFNQQLVSASGGWGSMAGASAGLGQVATGAGLGYLTGSLGDKLFGADTKASDYGAIGGAIGTAIMPGIGTAIGAGLGAIVGGFFGSTKVTGSGLYVGADTSSSTNISNYTDKKYKSWFSSSSWTDYSGLSSEQKESIDNLFKSYEYLTDYIGKTGDIVVKAGKYSASSLTTAVENSFFNNNFQNDIADAWRKYAKSINKTTLETLTAEINTYMQKLQDYKVWYMNYLGNTDASFQLQIDYQQKQKSLLEDTLGVMENAESYAKDFKKAFDEGLTPQELKNWELLGDTIEKISDLEKQRLDAQLKNEITNLKNEENIAKLKNDLLQQEQTAYINTITTVANVIKDMDSLAHSLDSTIDNINIKGQSDSYTKSFYLQRFADLNKEYNSYFENGILKDTADYDKAKNAYTSLNSVANSLSNYLGEPFTEGLRDSLSGALENDRNLLLDTESVMKVSLVEVGESVGLAKDETINLLNQNGVSISNDDWLKADNISNLAKDDNLTSDNSSVADWIKELYKAQASVNELNAKHLDSTFFQQGDTLGTQASIDFAKLTGLGIGTQEFNDLYDSLKIFDLKDDWGDFNYIKELFTVHPEYEDYFKNLKDVLPEDANIAYSTYNYEKTNQDFVETLKNIAFDLNRDIYDKYEGVLKDKTYLNFNMSDGFNDLMEKTAFDLIKNGNKDLFDKSFSDETIDKYLSEATKINSQLWWRTSSKDSANLTDYLNTELKPLNSELQVFKSTGGTTSFANEQEYLQLLKDIKNEMQELNKRNTELNEENIKQRRLLEELAS